MQLRDYCNWKKKLGCAPLSALNPIYMNDMALEFPISQLCWAHAEQQQSENIKTSEKAP